MRITGVTVRPWRLELKKPFVISLGTIREARNALVEVQVTTGEGRVVTGWGEAAPAGMITGETIEGAMSFVGQMAPLLEGRDPADLEDIWRLMSGASTRHFSAKAALDIALHDALGRALGVPVASLMGGAPRSFPTDITVGMAAPEEMAREAVEQVGAGFSMLKLKLGDDPHEDVRRVDAVRRAVGPDVILRLDANQGWTPLEALRVVEKVAPLDIQVVEQPVPADDLKGMAEVARRSPVAIMADESLFSPRDALRLAEARACHVFNIKLMKCGGLYRARQINAIAEAAFIRTFLGCMIESRVSISAACHFVAATSNVMGADLDAHMYLTEDPVRGGPRVESGTVVFPSGAGLGVEVD